jgi:hypothetical protein
VSASDCGQRYEDLMEYTVRSDGGLGIIYANSLSKHCGLISTPVDPAGLDCYRDGPKPC